MRSHPFYSQKKHLSSDKYKPDRTSTISKLDLDGEIVEAMSPQSIAPSNPREHAPPQIIVQPVGHQNRYKSSKYTEKSLPRKQLQELPQIQILNQQQQSMVPGNQLPTAKSNLYKKKNKRENDSIISIGNPSKKKILNDLEL